MKKNDTTLNLILVALFAAITSVCAWISVPIPITPVPVVLTTLGASLAGGILGWKYGSLSMIVYLLLGAIGLPVFHGFTAGFGIMAGPTGGYIIGFVFMALITGLLIDILCKSRLTWYGITIACVAGLVCCYAFGTAWFIISTGSTFAAAIMACILPFLPGDALKTAVAVLLILKLKPVLAHIKN